MRRRDFKSVDPHGVWQPGPPHAGWASCEATGDCQKPSLQAIEVSVAPRRIKAFQTWKPWDLSILFCYLDSSLLLTETATASCLHPHNIGIFHRACSNLGFPSPLSFCFVTLDIQRSFPPKRPSGALASGPCARATRALAHWSSSF